MRYLKNLPVHHHHNLLNPMNIKSILISCAGLAAMLSPVTPLSAATVPYSTEFTSSSDVSDWRTFGTSTTASWSVSGGYYVASSGNNSGTFVSTIPLTNFATTELSGFTVTTNFSIPDGSTGSYIGLAALGNDSLGNALLADFSASGTLRIGYFSSGTYSSLTLASSGDAVTLGGETTNYTATLSGTYETDGTLSLTFTLTNGIWTAIRTASVSSSVVSSTLSGQYFGLRLNNSTVNNNLTVQFDNFSVSTTAIPEPSTIALLAGLGILLVSLAGRHFRKA